MKINHLIRPLKVPAACRLLMLLAGSSLLSFCSCSSDTESVGGRDRAVVRMAFFAEGQQGQRRALTVANWSAVNNLAVAIYDDGGGAIGYQRETTPVADGTGMYTLDVATHAAKDCSIYAAANVVGDLFGDGSKLSDVKNKKITRTALTDLASDTEVPMVGVYSSTVDITGGTQTIGNVELKRLCSRIDVTLSAATGITLTSLQLCHLPRGSWYVERTPATWTAPAAYDDFSEVTVTGSTTFSQSYFVYESLAGTVEGLTAETDRHKDNAPTDASYLLIGATGDGWKTVFRVYLGGVDTGGAVNHNNFNIYRNCHYTVNVQVNGSSDSDLRIDKRVETIGMAATLGDWTGTTEVPGVAE